MIFTLEALQAEQGDSLILHYGDSAQPRFIVIDGGPDTVFDRTLQPRLDQLRRHWANSDGRLPIDMVMVSHIDDDHINGILAWFRSLREKEDHGEALPDTIRTLWFNSFDEILDNDAEELRAVLSSRAASARQGGGEAADFNPDPRQAAHSAAVIASVGQGRELRSIATKLSIPLNLPFRGLVMPSAQAGNRTVTLDNGLQLHILGPTKEQVAALQEQWRKNIRRRPGVEAAAFADRSVANLASIVAIAELNPGTGSRRILLTGDARGDFIWDGLIHAGFLRDRSDRIHFDVIKMPHHGSDRNITQEWLEHITADHYVISANGEHDNPDAVVFEWLANARGAAPYTVHITNQTLVNPRKPGPAGDISQQVDAALQKTAAVAVHRTILFRSPNDLSLTVDLGATPVNY